jgi:hypothetical protein
MGGRLKVHGFGENFVYWRVDVTMIRGIYSIKNKREKRSYL